MPIEENGQAVLTQVDFVGQLCTNPGCDHEGHGPLYLHSNCHNDAPTWVGVQDGIAVVECSICEKVIARLKLAI